MCGCRSSSPASRATSAPRSPPRSQREGHAVRGFARSPERVAAAGVEVDDLVLGDAVTGAGLDGDRRGRRRLLPDPLDGGPADGAFAEQERRAAERFAAAAQAAGVRRIVYLGGLVPREGAVSRHLASRLAVEEALLDAAPSRSRCAPRS